MISTIYLAPQRKIIRFVIDGFKVVYYDENWKEGIQIYPMDKKLVRTLLNSKSAYNQARGKLIEDANSGDNLKEYLSCKDEQEIYQMIKKDASKNGLMEVSSK